MKLTLCKRSAIAVIRSLRTDAARYQTFFNRTDAASPDPFPRKRWSSGLLSALDLGVPLTLGDIPIDVAVPDQLERLRAKGVSSTTYSGSIPPGAFIDLGNGIVSSGPELAFVEMADSMNPVEHLMLGHELCGSFSRDPLDPYNGPITYGVKPVTSKWKIRSFLDGARYMRGIEKAVESLSYLNDNAWSPTESLVAALLRLPVDSLGYDIGELVLNPRVRPTRSLPGAKESRVPDIMIKDTRVGVNYDGLVHLDLSSVVDAALNVGMYPGASQSQAVLDKALKGVRDKAVDDIRRNRELASEGLFVFPVVKEDLYVPGGFDLVVASLLDALEKLSGLDVGEQRKTLRMKTLSRERHRAILSLLPGKSERGIQIGRFIGGHEVVDGPQEIAECWIEL